MAPIKWNRIFEKIQNKSGKEKITIVVLTGILLLVISLPTGSKSGQTETNENTQTRQTGLSESAKSYETVLEEKLEKALKKVEGVGEVSVVITLKNTSEKIIAADSDYSEGDDPGKRQCRGHAQYYTAKRKHKQYLLRYAGGQ